MLFNFFLWNMNFASDVCLRFLRRNKWDDCWVTININAGSSHSLISSWKNLITNISVLRCYLSKPEHSLRYWWGQCWDCLWDALNHLVVLLEAEDQVKVGYQFELILASLVSKRKMKWIDHPKWKFCHNFTHPHVIPNVFFLSFCKRRFTFMLLVDDFYSKWLALLSLGIEPMNLIA